MKMREMFINIGGLMRCCTGTISDLAENQPDREYTEGERIDCKYEKKPTMKVEGNRISWVGVEEATRTR